MSTELTEPTLAMVPLDDKTCRYPEIYDSLVRHATATRHLKQLFTKFKLKTDNLRNDSNVYAFGTYDQGIDRIEDANQYLQTLKNDSTRKDTDFSAIESGIKEMALSLADVFRFRTTKYDGEPISCRCQAKGATLGIASLVFAPLIGSSGSQGVDLVEEAKELSENLLDEYQTKGRLVLILTAQSQTRIVRFLKAPLDRSCSKCTASTPSAPPEETRRPWTAAEKGKGKAAPHLQY